MNILKIYFILIGLTLALFAMAQDFALTDTCACDKTYESLNKKDDLLSYKAKKNILINCAEISKDIDCFFRLVYVIYFDLEPYENFEKAIIELDTLEMFFLRNEKKLEKIDFISYLGSVHNTKGYFYNLNGYYDDATIEFDKAIKLFENSDKVSEGLLKSYIYKGEIQKKVGKYIESIDTYLKALEYMRPRQEKLQKSGRISKYHNYLGSCYEAMHNYEQAIRYYKDAINLASDEGESIDAMISAHLGLSSCYVSTDQLRLANNHLVAAARLPVEYPSITNSIYNQKILLSKILEPNNVLNVLEERLNHNLKFFGSTHYITNEVYCQLAQYYLDKNDPETALTWTLKALNCVWDKDSKGIDQQIKSKLEPTNFPIKHLIQSLNLYSEAGQKLHKLKTDSNRVNAAWSSSLFAIDLLKKARLSLKNEEEQQLFTQINHQTFERALNILYSRYEIYPSREILEQAFDLMEASKAFTLRLAAARSRAKQFSNVPEKVIEKENALLSGIRDIEMQFMQGKAVRDMVENTFLNENLLYLRSEYNSFQEEIKDKYPDYFKLKSNVLKVSLDELQNELLTDKTTFLEYFLSETTCYLLLINADDEHFLRLNMGEDFLENLNEFLSLIRDSKTFDHAEQVRAFENLAHYLYKVLVDPIEPLLAERLQIIPDGILLLLPFDALLTNRVEKSGFYTDYPFLLNEKAIQYNFSASMWSEMINAQADKTTESLCVYAPVFKGDNQISDRSDGISQISALQYNQAEAKSIRKIFKGKLFSGATRDEFKSSCDDCQIIHIASHGKASAGMNDESWILFNSDTSSSGEEKLKLHEIYNLDLNSDLLVLSACETSRGKMVRGEGILSFARSFSFAGTKSILTSLWQVDDEATKDLMTLFYRNLRKGKSKDVALQKAKLQYLKSARKNAPNYWAAFVAVGDMNPIVPGSSPLIFWIIFPVAILIWYLVRKKRMNVR